MINDSSISSLEEENAMSDINITLPLEDQIAEAQRAVVAFTEDLEEVEEVLEVAQEQANVGFL